MDKNAIKKYAIWARRELIARVSQRAALYEITADGYGNADAVSVHGRILSLEERNQRKALIAQIQQKGFEQVMEEIAYTWFNRFSALRFMEVNGYLPSHVRVFTDEENNFKPQIMTEAIHLEMDGLDMQKVFAFKDANDDDGLFKYLIITQCNALSSVLPGMFQKISDYTELLFPDNLLRKGSVVEQMVSMIPEEDWTDQVQIIGWLYQYYNTEPKDQVFSNLKKNIKISKENIPAATQLFTPDWIVRYMVENSLGRLWIEGHPNDELKTSWKYYLDEAEQEEEVQKQLAEIRKEYAALKPEDIRCIDPCMGSGHILVYMFDVLVQIYESYGYTAREAASSIVENNIWGLDIDERAAQLAYFSVMMKARHYDKRFFTKTVQPHTYAIQETNSIKMDYIHIKSNLQLSAEHLHTMTYLIDTFVDAKEYGSILRLEKYDYSGLKDALKTTIKKAIDSVDTFTLWHTNFESQLLIIIDQAIALTQSYNVVITNPPYMSNSGMGNTLNKYVKQYYPHSKTDLFSVFIERNFAMLSQYAYQGMITQHAWMFLTSFEKLRQEIQRKNIINMIHLGARAFEEIGGEVVQTTCFVIRNYNVLAYKGTYCRLVEPLTQNGKEMMYLSGKNRYITKQENFSNIHGYPIDYWLSDKFISFLSQQETIGSKYESGSGLSTADNNRFLRFFWEVERDKIAYNKGDNKKWYLFHKGGEFRKWYGNLFYVVNWENEGEEIKYWVTHNPNDPNTTSWSRRIFNTHLYFLSGITWSVISSGDISFRAIDSNAMISNAAGGIFGFKSVEERDNFMAALNTAIWTKAFATINPTLNYSSGVIQKAPCPEIISTDLGKKCRELAKKDWDDFETSLDFQIHPLILYCIGLRSYTIEKAYQEWVVKSNERFLLLKQYEEEINSLYISAYRLEQEFESKVSDDRISIHKAERQRDVRSLISYAVGCMFGRYSLDFPGLVYAGGKWDMSKYKTYVADSDAIIPICDDEYFNDDIVSRFIKFVEVVYGKETLEENLKFIADALGGNGTSREVIRNYFINSFYADHLKVYQKRPIYWLFDSGKQNGFKCLVYMHRYQPDTIARIRTDYVHEQQSRYRTAMADLQNRIDNAATTSERVKLTKKLKTVREQDEELRIYEEKIHHLADQMIKIDLDDGVKVNYAKFQDVLAKIK